jgi:biopolymer transport protein ExbB/TolQ
VIRSPLVWGLLATVGYYGLLHGGTVARLLGTVAHDFLYRYTAAHPLLVVELGLFCVGMAVLVLRRMDVAEQTVALRHRLLPEPPPQGNTAADCPALLAALDALPHRRQHAYLPARLRAALTYVQQRGSADALDDELKYLSESDHTRAHNSQALVRVIVGAIPILGFLGTVVGITLAIASLDPQQLESSMKNVVAGLGVAFDSTALALALSIVLLFTKHHAEQAEGRLLARVEQATARELSGRFGSTAAPRDPQIAAVRRMAETVIDATRRLVEQQTELWQHTITAAREEWRTSSSAARQQLEAALGTALRDALAEHARAVAASSHELAQRNHQHLAAVQQALAEHARIMQTQQAEMARQGQTLLQVVQATGQVVKLEEALHRNLAALAAAQNFEGTLQSLAAVIHLLNARLAQSHAVLPALAAKESSSVGRAA